MPEEKFLLLDKPLLKGKWEKTLECLTLSLALLLRQLPCSLVCSTPVQLFKLSVSKLSVVCVENAIEDNASSRVYFIKVLEECGIEPLISIAAALWYVALWFNTVILGLQLVSPNPQQDSFCTQYIIPSCVSVWEEKLLVGKAVDVTSISVVGLLLFVELYTK